MSFILRLLLSSISVFLAAYILPGIRVDGFFTAIIVALVIAFLNSLVKPLFVILTIPLTVITFGFFLLVINAIIILLAEWIVTGLVVDGFWCAFLFSIVLSFVSYLLGLSSKEQS